MQLSIPNNDSANVAIGNIPWLPNSYVNVMERPVEDEISKVHALSNTFI